MIPESFDVTVPDHWTSLPPTPGCAMLVAEPEPADGDFRASLSLVLEDVPDTVELDLGTYASTRTDSLARLLTDALVVDEELSTLAGHPALVTTIAYRQGTMALTLRQWTAVVDGCGLLMGAVCSNDRLPGLMGTMEEIVASLELERARS